MYVERDVHPVLARPKEKNVQFVTERVAFPTSRRVIHGPNERSWTFA